MGIIVQKYGGSSVSTTERVRAVAELIKARVDQGHRLCVVVSAMGHTTDELLADARALHDAPPRRELDMLLSCGERASTALLAMALDAIGVPSISFTGSQSGIITNDSHAEARILEVRPYRVQDELDKGRVVIVAGFQGVSYKREITTLGRGGSDTTAVALAATLNADACEIYSDVDGVYSADPRVIPAARRLSEISYEEMQELAAAGAKVLNAQAVEFAKDKGIALFARQTGGGPGETIIRRDAPAPVGGVRGVTHKSPYFVLEADTLDAASALMDALATHKVTPVQVRGRFDGAAAGLSCLLAPDDAHEIEALFAQLPDGCRRADDMGAVSMVGAGILEEAGVIAKALRTFAEAGIDVRGVSSSSFRVTLMCDVSDVENGARALHSAFVDVD